MRLRIIPFLVFSLYGSGTPYSYAAQNMPPLAVDPALLGGARPMPAPAEGAATSTTTPGAAPATSAAPAAKVPAAAGTEPQSSGTVGASPPAEQSASPSEPSPFPPPRLSAQGDLKPLPLQGDKRVPIYFDADKLTGQGENETVAEGSVVVRRADTTLWADKLTYWQIEDEAEAEGNVKMTRGQDVVTGPKARMKLSESVGWFEQPVYSIHHEAQPGTKRLASTGSGEADRIDFEGENHYRLKNATYSTCEAPPDWYFKAGEMTLDYDREEGEAKHAQLYFKDVPIFYLPYGGFPLNNNRKSGFLPPTIGVNNRTGFDLSVPYYWNIAPNYDATISPRLMSRRGVQLGGEFRYLFSNITGDGNGSIRAEYLPSDRVTGEDRTGYSIKHEQRFTSKFSGALDVNGVSDDQYFKDLSTRLTTTSQTYLVRQGTLSYAGDWWTAGALVQRYQTLQDVIGTRIDEPYRRLPQLTLNAVRPEVYGTQFDFKSEYVNFRNPDTTLPEGQRLYAYPQLSLPLQTSSIYLIPKIGVSYTQYKLDRRLSAAPVDAQDSITRTLPIFSVDSGLTLERDSSWLGRAATQTLEPRVYYLRVPAKNQDQIPVFDTSPLDFNFATIFAENLYSGIDRIADANQLTAAVTSRFIDSETGSEIVRAGLGQRYYFREQTVGLPNEVKRTEKTADVLAAFSGRVLPNTFFDSALQYNPRDQRTERYNIALRYQPGYAQVLNLSYRFLNDRAPTASEFTDANGTVQTIGLRDLDLSGQWPLLGRWYGVGRFNYSLRQSRLIELIAGVEYNAGCWVMRAVAQRFAAGASGTSQVGLDPTVPTSYTTAFFLQLELNGFSQIGTNPLDVLKRSISGYGRINQPGNPVFGSDDTTSPY